MCLLAPFSALHTYNEYMLPAALTTRTHTPPLISHFMAYEGKQTRRVFRRRQSARRYVMEHKTESNIVYHRRICIYICGGLNEVQAQVLRPSTTTLTSRLAGWWGELGSVLGSCIATHYMHTSQWWPNFEHKNVFEPDVFFSDQKKALNSFFTSAYNRVRSPMNCWLTDSWCNDSKLNIYVYL